MTNNPAKQKSDGAMIEFVNDDFWIRAQSIEATFGDGSSMELDTISVNATTPIGVEILLTSSTIQHPQKRSIRLILIKPDQDWRQTADYAWKLDNAWMADQLAPDSPTYSWLHWNVESFVDSSIQVPEYNKVWKCNEMEFYFKSIGKTSASSGFHSSSQLTPIVTLTDLHIGAMLSQSSKAFEMYIPPECKGQEDCKFVDGKSKASGSTSSIHDLLEGKDSKLVFAGLGGIILLVLCLSLVCKGRCRKIERRSEQYESIQAVEMKDADDGFKDFGDEEEHGNHSDSLASSAAAREEE